VETLKKIRITIVEKGVKSAHFVEPVLSPWKDVTIVQDPLQTAKDTVILDYLFARQMGACSMSDNI